MEKILFPVIGREQELPLFVRGIGIEFPQNDIFRPAGYPYSEFVLFTKGEGVISFDDSTFQLKPNSLFYMPHGYPHEYHTLCDGWESWWVCFDGAEVHSLLARLGIDKPQVYCADDISRLLRILRRAYQTMEADRMYGNYYASAALYEFIIELHKCTQGMISSVDAITHSGISHAVDVINSDFAKKISMEMLCEASNLSESHLCRLFKKHLGMRPMEYLNRRRIEEARKLLELSYLSMESVSEQVGIDSVSYFGKLFRRYEGMSPSEYRQLHKGEKTL